MDSQRSGGGTTRWRRSSLSVTSWTDRDSAWHLQRMEQELMSEAPGMGRHGHYPTGKRVMGQLIGSLSTLAARRAEVGLLSYNVVLNSMAKFGSRRIVHQLYSRMQAVKVKPDQRTYIAVASVHARHGDVEAVKKHLGALSDRDWMDCQTGRYARNTMLTGLVRAGLGEEVLELIGKTPSFLRDSHTYTAGLSVAVGGKPRIMHLMRSMRRQRISPVHQHYGAAMRAAAVRGDLKTAESLIHEMKNRRLVP
eukprot:Hpha_TRINITY_DN5846_c0_g1::TRINITY_DN5846_c0_g1_i1::g.45635::m.45635